GVNNRRNALNKETLSIPVIAVGVPTVSDSSSVLYDSVKEILSDFNIDSESSEGEEIISAYLKEHSENMMVTPKNIDAIVARSSVILSRAINLSVHKNLSYEDITDYIS
ncbi:MAG: GPR endopeptidase, partial [Clostridia bacterium]|nr:GPR endopeptidase [Clostridia bacterium]